MSTAWPGNAADDMEEAERLGGLTGQYGRIQRFVIHRAQYTLVQQYICQELESLVVASRITLLTWRQHSDGTYYGKDLGTTQRFQVEVVSACSRPGLRRGRAWSSGQA